MAVTDWGIPVGCAAGLGFMTYALLRGGLGSARCPDTGRPVTFVLDLADEQHPATAPVTSVPDLADKQHPVTANRSTDHRVAGCRLVQHIS